MIDFLRSKTRVNHELLLSFSLYFPASGMPYNQQLFSCKAVTNYFDTFLNYVEGLKDLKNNNIEYLFRKTKKSNGPC